MTEQHESEPKDGWFPENDIPIAEAQNSRQIKVEELAQDPEIPVEATSGCLPGLNSSTNEALHSRQTADIEEQEVALMLFSLSRGVNQTKPAKPTIRSASHHDLSSLQMVS